MKNINMPLLAIAFVLAGTMQLSAQLTSVGRPRLQRVAQNVRNGQSFIPRQPGNQIGQEFGNIKDKMDRVINELKSKISEISNNIAGLTGQINKLAPSDVRAQGQGQYQSPIDQNHRGANRKRGEGQSKYDTEDLGRVDK